MAKISYHDSFDNIFKIHTVVSQHLSSRMFKNQIFLIDVYKKKCFNKEKLHNQYKNRINPLVLRNCCVIQSY